MLMLQQKQQMFRGREASIWEMEKSQLHERHQLIKTQLKDLFFVKRHQMLTRHQKVSVFRFIEGSKKSQLLT